MIARIAAEIAVLRQVVFHAEPSQLLCLPTLHLTCSFRVRSRSFSRICTLDSRKRCPTSTKSCSIVPGRCPCNTNLLASQCRRRFEVMSQFVQLWQCALLKCV